MKVAGVVVEADGGDVGVVVIDDDEDGDEEDESEGEEGEEVVTRGRSHCVVR